jgi:hypothetical protein
VAFFSSNFLPDGAKSLWRSTKMKRILPTLFAVTLIVLLGTFVGGAVIHDFNTGQSLFSSTSISFTGENTPINTIDSDNGVDASMISTVLLLATSLIGLRILGRRRSFKGQ